MTDKNIELVKKLLTDSGAKIHPMTKEVIVYAYKGNKTFVCSLFGRGLTVSISVNGKANLDIAQKSVRKVFGKRFTITRLVEFPMDNVQANYFGLTLVH
ncbi:hypothetical protein A4G19_13120 [Pasteurellaceae bacterium Macca]|nr:hypothetical protein [Pasteurellaceae bacterium Macca]MCK3656209.1 hypothetical protein [Pasteurellaceae bacterium Macca]MCK3656636.1 hypothetical protein [Pasteurellaceae bacterium Macca]